MQKRSFQRFRWMPFTEHPHKDYVKESIMIYDVTTIRFSDAPSDFLVNGVFDHALYCECLIELIFSLPRQKLTIFLEYQCGLLDDPKRWMVQLDLLLNNNYDSYLVRPNLSKLNFIIQLIEDKGNDYVFDKRKSMMHTKLNDINQLQERFDIVKVKEAIEKKETLTSKLKFLNRIRTNYLQEVENNAGKMVFLNQ